MSAINVVFLLINKNFKKLYIEIYKQVAHNSFLVLINLNSNFQFRLLKI